MRISGSIEKKDYKNYFKDYKSSMGKYKSGINFYMEKITKF
jgi:hypothetical protein